MNFNNPKIITDWAFIPEYKTGPINGRTHGICVLNSGNILVFHQHENAFLEYDSAGKLLRQFGGDHWMHAHGLTIANGEGEEVLWVTDEQSGKASKLDLQGRVLIDFSPPPLDIYEGENERPYLPTAIAPNPETGDVWIGDGYGAHYLHRYSEDGEYLDSFNNIKGAGELKEPHGFAFTTHNGATELWIADRANQRLLVCSPDGRLLRKTSEVHTPSYIAFFGNYAAVCELFTGIKILEKESLAVVAEVGKNPDVNIDAAGGWDVPEGWPNLRGTGVLKNGCFNSPHQCAFDAGGNLYVVEWIIGGRINKVEFL